jgi:hypothetical protein
VTKRGLTWRSLLVLGYVAWTLVCTFVFGGGTNVLIFFAVWGGIWLAFSSIWRWADEARRSLLRKRGW